MSNSLTFLKTQLQMKYPALSDLFNPPATLEQIAYFESTVGQPLPKDLKQAYLQHNGCSYPAYSNSNGKPQAPSLFSQGCQWVSLEEVAKRWLFQCEIFESFADSPYSYTEDEDPSSWCNDIVRPWEASPPNWLPIGIKTDTHVCVQVDLLPGAQGNLGQLLDDTTGMTTTLIAKSFEQYILELAHSLERNEVVFQANGSQSYWCFVANGNSFKCIN